MTLPLVLLPGMNCSPALWDAVRPLLPGGVPVLDREVTEPTLDAAVAALLDDLPDRFDLAGLSLGGIVAMALVRVAPERVRRLALLSTNARPPTEPQLAAWDATVAQLDTGASARDLQADLLPLLLSEATAEQSAATLRMADQVGAAVLANQLRCQATRVDERPGLSAVRSPTLVLAAENDALCPVERHAEIAGAISGARLVVLRGSGHLSPLQAPDAVARALASWLA